MCWRRGGVEQPCSGDLKGISAPDNESLVYSGEDEVCAGAEGDKRCRLFVDFRKIHGKSMDN